MCVFVWSFCWLQELGRATEGFSGSDVNTAVKDVLMQPIRILRDATHFKKVSGRPRCVAIGWLSNMDTCMGAASCCMFHCHHKLRVVDGPLVLTYLCAVLVTASCILATTLLERNSCVYSRALLLCMCCVMALSGTTPFSLPLHAHAAVPRQCQLLPVTVPVVMQKSCKSHYDHSCVLCCIMSFPCVSPAVQVRHPVTGGDGYVPCAPLDPGAQECSLQYFADKGIADQVVPPTITMKDFVKVLERARPTVSTKDLEVRGGGVRDKWVFGGG